MRIFGNGFLRGGSGPARVTDAGADDREAPGKVRIGLALGGGAARGWTHIGVLHALEEAGISPSIVAGTSIGAVVGGCYVAGGLDELERFATGLTRRRVFGLMDLSFAGSGLIGGNRLARLLEDGLQGKRIESFDKSFVSVATELATGHEIWLSRGPIVEAMRASYALPGIFKPVRVSGRWLVDGALVNPIPVSVCRALGANFVIAVNLSADGFGRGTVVQNHVSDPLAELLEEVPEEGFTDTRQARRAFRRQLIGRDTGPPSISSVMMEAFNIIQDRIARSRLAGDPPDVMIGPKLGKIGLFEFHRAREMIDIGYQCSRRMVGEIKETVAALA
ncbi:MAG: patatin-like phospholipase family protein [Bauldia sp.]